MKKRLLVTALGIFGIYCSLAFINVESKQLKLIDSVKLSMTVEEYKSLKQALSNVPQRVMESKNIPAAFAVETYNIQSNEVSGILQFLGSKEVKVKK